MIRRAAPPLALAVAAILLVFATAPGAPAQIQAERIVGTIYDPNKAVVPGASLTVINKATNVARRMTTNAVGGYVVPALDPGVYDVSVTAPGFRTTVRPGVEMQVGKDLLLDMDLVLGETNVGGGGHGRGSAAQLRVGHAGARDDQLPDRRSAAQRARVQ